MYTPPTIIVSEDWSFLSVNSKSVPLPTTTTSASASKTLGPISTPLSPTLIITGSVLKCRSNQENEVMKGGMILVPRLWHIRASPSSFPEIV